MIVETRIVAVAIANGMSTEKTHLPQLLFLGNKDMTSERVKRPKERKASNRRGSRLALQIFLVDLKLKNDSRQVSFYLAWISP